MNIDESIAGKLRVAIGRRAISSEFDVVSPTLSAVVPEWLNDLMTHYPVVGSLFTLDPEHDASGGGAEAVWLSPQEMNSEAQDSYPGVEVVRHGLPPFASDALGSGDYYYLELTDDDPPLVRVRHTAASTDGVFDPSSVELVCSHLSVFLRLAEGETMTQELSCDVPRLSLDQSFAALMEFLRHYGRLMADKEGVATLLERVDPDASGQPTSKVCSEWRRAIEVAISEPHVRRARPLRKTQLVVSDTILHDDSAPDPTCSPREAFDAMIRLLEDLEPDFRTATAFLQETDYNVESTDGELNTADPYTWWEWLGDVRVSLQPPLRRAAILRRTALRYHGRA